MEDLAEFKALEDDEARRQAFQKFVKRQKVCSTLSSDTRLQLTGLQEKLREQHSDDESTSSRRRKEPYGTRHRSDYDRERDRDRDHRDYRDDRYSRYRDRERDRDRYRDDYSSSRRHRDEHRASSSGRRKDDRDEGRDRSKDVVKKDREGDVEMRDAKVCFNGRLRQFAA
jgi:pre-mRNA-processing factor 40